MTTWIEIAYYVRQIVIKDRVINGLHLVRFLSRCGHSIPKACP